MALPHHGAAHDYKGRSGEAELVGAKNACHQDVKTSSHLTVSLKYIR